ncbi:CGNR zinc finger domain-containing protein [Allobranchiibius sp. GilTou38]|uniref:CGNR zinc finger domain-containing protein n=1 Tax=Allobranchiibius sp. GilTou38 TaxID=2815210 RepID=UPI001AA0F683|nr:CGNR zinc finger domain-containing protein [Allobranchiibius sp. GilTou38]
MTSQVDFGSHVDGVVAVGRELVNVATPGERQGRPYDVPGPAQLLSGLADAVRLSGRDARVPDAGAMDAFIDLARRVRPVYELVEAREMDQAAEVTNALLDRYAARPRLESHGGQPWHLHFHGDRGADASGWGAAVGMGLATVLGSEYADRLGVCAAPACDRVFVDVSRNGLRRFCSEACQSRVKAAAHRARQRA